MDPAKKLATADDLRALGEDVRAEILSGQIVLSPPPLFEHGRAQSSFGGIIGGPFDRDGNPGGWWIASEVDLELSRHEILRPDVCGWRRERVPDPPKEWPVRVMPDWVCEILSPSNVAHDRVHKAQRYASAGVSFLWLVDPPERLLEAFRLEGDAWLRIGAWDGTGPARVPPFDAIEIPLDRVFLPR